MTTTTFPAFANEYVKYQDWPPAPVLWLSASLDTLCEGRFCQEWRSVGPSPSSSTLGSWLSHRVPPLTDTLPPLLSYTDFDFLQQQQPPSPQPFRLSSLRQYAFHTQNTELGDLSSPTALAVLLVLVGILRTLKRTWIPQFRAWGRQAGRQRHGRDWEAQNEDRIMKFGEYVFRLGYHSFITILGLKFFFHQAWWKRGGTIHLYQNFPYHPIEPTMAWYYLIQAAWNVDALLEILQLSLALHWRGWISSSSSLSRPSWQWPLTLGWASTVRGDFQEMCVHHLITNSLVFISSICRLHRIGSMVFMVHDISDIPIDVSKLANFLKYKTATVVGFATLCTLWIITRLYILPFIIYKSILTEGHLVMVRGKIPPVLYVCYQPIFVLLLPALILLHFWWFLMFVRMAYMLVAKYECHDYSEHRTGESQLASQKYQGQKKKKKMDPLEEEDLKMKEADDNKTVETADSNLTLTTSDEGHLEEKKEE